MADLSEIEGAAASNPHQNSDKMVNDEAMEIIPVNDINFAPEQDSPKHILNILDDGMIQEILRRVDDIVDFHSAAEVCVPFQENAIGCFPTFFKNIDIGSHPCSISYQLVPRFLSIFGHLIEDIYWGFYASDAFQDQSVLDAITKNCAQTIKCLLVEEHRVNFDSQSIFPKLEELNISGDAGLSEKIEIFIEFLKNHPQLRILVLYHSNVASSIFQHIGAYTSGLEEFEFQDDITIRESDLISLTGLRQLKSLKIRSRGRVDGSLKNVVEAFVNNQIPLEELALPIWEKDETDIGKHLSQLKCLKYLELMDLSDDLLLYLVKNLPVLESIRIEFGTGITVHGIEEVLKFGGALKWILLNEMNIQVEMVIEDATMNTVPKEVLLANRYWVHVRDEYEPW